jgi:hypothetical protein
MKNILDYENGRKYTPVILNPPKIFLFDDKESAYDFFDQYMNDVDVLDERCKRGEEVEHVDFCTCGIIDMDENDRPILFYNKLNQIYLLEYGASLFTIPQSVKIDIHNMNVTHRLIRKCKNLQRVQRKKYIELGRVCQECEDNEEKNARKYVMKTEDKSNNSDMKSEITSKPVSVPEPTPAPVAAVPVPVPTTKKGKATGKAAKSKSVAAASETST